MQSIIKTTSCLFYGLIRAVILNLAVMNMMVQAAICEPTPEKASYKVTLISISPLKLIVNAAISVDGTMLGMDNTYPAELPEMASTGWPTLISNLVVRDSTGEIIPVTTVSFKGWQLPDSMCSNISLSYEVDYSIFAANKWSSPLESVFADDSNIVIAGRSVFITTSKIETIEVEITTPKDWITIAPWMTDKNNQNHYSVTSRENLTNNMLVFSRNKPDVVTSAGFKMQIVPIGHWQPLRPLVNNILETIIDCEINLMQYKGKEIYNIVLLPVLDKGGNAFRQSFVYCYSNPDKNNMNIWGNTLAHEIFHYWNYGILKGADYGGSQWFQEGFTEYVANLVMITGRIIDPDMFIGKLSDHINNYRKLTSTLENYGTHKGPPLYSAGALVAFIWDVEIMRMTEGEKNIGDFFQNLMIQTGSGTREYSWEDIKASLQATADSDWEFFYQSYIKGHEPLPLETSFPLIGLRIYKLADGSEQVEYDPDASEKTKILWHMLIGN